MRMALPFSSSAALYTTPTTTRTIFHPTDDERHDNGAAAVPTNNEPRRTTNDASQRRRAMPVAVAPTTAPSPAAAAKPVTDTISANRKTYGRQHHAVFKNATITRRRCATTNELDENGGYEYGGGLRVWRWVQRRGATPCTTYLFFSLSLFLSTRRPPPPRFPS
ncbi:hypothetical protein BD410DRAFT_899268 [Rickenella mellea]|uniref:Uncharacterized protein n=1 Tax=Rickenella mellea TaxID=50990 RepID=A0A4Y7Q2B5_9AGAM|nr:hypothetical protein BD410DRAFT_899268 [Rickenella mellea]